MSATVKGGFWPENSVTTLATIETTSSHKQQLRQVLRKKGMREMRARMRALNGVVAGGAALATQARVEANEELGGKRTVETETFINRVTVAGDATEINDDVLSDFAFTNTPVANLDGNPLGTR